MNSKQFLESTTSGSVATVATPVGKTQTRGKGVYPNEKGGNLLTGKKTNKKYANSNPMKEAKLDEEDVIIVPGQGNRIKPGFIPRKADRTDHEVEMALSDLFQSAKNAKQVYELIKDIPETVGIEGWVQEKIIKANDYLNTIREYLEHKQMSEMTVGVIAGGGVGEGVAEGYRILPNIDREKYQERQGLEGPFRARNGKVYYYDPKAGMAYDPDTDFYIDYDELKMMDREMSEGIVGKVLGGAALLASLWGIGQNQAQQAYSDSPQLQTLIKYHQMATQQGDQAKIQELERRIENQKTRLSLGKGEVMGSDNKPIVPSFESSIMKGIQNEAKKIPKKCPECGGKLVAESELNEEGNKDACYHKVKSRYKVWPSAYASGALVKCRKVGASNWGDKKK